MDAYEATKVVFSRIKSIDPENASKIMGLLLIQDHGDKEMIRLAFGPENLLHALVSKARHELLSPKTTPANNVFASKSGLNPSSPPFYAAGAASSNSRARPRSSDMVYMSELLGGAGESMLRVHQQQHGVARQQESENSSSSHRRSCSVNDISGSESGNSRFGEMEMMEKCRHHNELIRSKSMQNHNHKLMSCSINKGFNLFGPHQHNDSPRAAAMMLEETLHKLSRSSRGLDNYRVDSSPASRQIYLTFPADSTFREEDVSSYFSIYGPVEDVRIPYQQKRMFGFVTFVFPETVKIILAKGNPHFVCDSRVLVKPYKEKGKVPDKFRKNQQQFERGEFSSCGSPTSVDYRDPFDLPPGARMMYETQAQYMLWRRKLEEEADLQQALELQTRRLTGLQLLDIKRNHHHRSFSTGAHSIHSPTQSPNSIFHQALTGSDRSSPDASDEICTNTALNEAKQVLQQTINEVTDIEKEISVGGEDANHVNGKESPCRQDNAFNLVESMEHFLPDSPFASPDKECGGESCEVEVTTASANSNSKIPSFLPSSPALDMASVQSCYFQMPRFSPGHGAIGM